VTYAQTIRRAVPLARRSAPDRRRSPRLPPAPALVLRTATLEDRAGLVGLVEACSARSLAQRFLTGVGGTPPAGLVDRLLVPRTPIGRATLALLDEQVVAHGMWASTSAVPGHPAELALLVRDDLQGRGIGSALVRALHAEIVAWGIDWVEVNTAADNRLVTGMIARRAPGVRAERDGATLTYRLPSDLLRAA
jgi:GNAT superfamily N-acetyltransferase